MQTSGQFGVPPSEVTPQIYNPVNNDMNNSSNSSSRATSIPGSNQTLGHMLFNLSNHDQQQHVSSLSPSSAYTTNPHSGHVQQNGHLALLGKKGLHDSTGTELLQEAASHQNHEDRHFSDFFPAAGAAASMEHFQRSGGESMQQYQPSSTSEKALVHLQQQAVQQTQGNSASGAPVSKHAPSTTPTPSSSVQAHSLTAAHAAHMAAPTPDAHTHRPNHTDSDNAEVQNQAQAMQLHHQLSLGLDQSINEAANPSASNMKSRESQLMIPDPPSLGDIDQAEREEGAGAGNRWPRQETLALLKIRADMDAAFRDSSVKRPLWDEVSRKLGELGYERSAKKCKEKFENVNKYYKRTKDGKVGRQDGKSYRFFTQLEALATNTINHSSMLKFKLGSAASVEPSFSTVLAGTPAADNEPPAEVHFFASSAPLNAQPLAQLPSLDMPFHPPRSDPNASTALHHSTSQSSDDQDEEEDDDGDNEDDDDDVDDDDSDGDDVIDEDDPQEYHRSNPHPDAPPAPSHARPPTDSKKRKRKSSTSMMAFFESLLKKVIDKQEQMQQKFLQAMEKRESDRMIREEAWRRQEMARLSKEHEIRAQERNSAAARDAALVAFLQKVTGQALDLPTVTTSTSFPIAAQPVQSAPPLHQDNTLHQYDDPDMSDPSSKRWLKPEVLHLIELHSSLQAKFTEAGPKGPLWEEIALGMAKKGYPNRTAKRCKEKWENINKYFKRAKESNKKRPENAKTCPYFHELDALYRKGSNVNQLPYKPSIDEHAQDENFAHQQPLMSNTREEDFDCASSLQMQPTTTMPPECAAVLDASNASATDANNISTNVGDVMMRNVTASNGILPSLGSMQLSMDAFRGLNATNTSDHVAPRSGSFSAELGLSIQQQSSTMDILHHKQVEFGKVTNVRGEHMESNIVTQSSRLQSKESKPSLAPLPNSSSFMANMLQKLSSNNTSANNNAQDQ